jgi:hypothetical protein
MSYKARAVWTEVISYDLKANLSGGVKGNYERPKLGYPANGPYVVCTERLL